jgi:hypothetical protein
MPAKAKTGNGSGGNWKIGAPSNNVKGWPFGGIGEAWQHVDLVVTVVQLRWRGKLRRVDAPEGMIMESFLQASTRAGSRLRMMDWKRGEQRLRAGLMASAGFQARGNCGLTSVGRLERMEVMRNRADPMIGSRVQ